MKEPKSLLEAIRFFSDPDVCLDFMAHLRWPDAKPVCPTCGSTEVRFISTRRLWECKTKHPRKQFSIKVGTIFEDSPIGLDKWLAAIWMIANDKNGVSSYELSRALDVTQKTAWFMLHRIRLAMRDESFDRFDGEVEADETYIGGKTKFMHKEKLNRIRGGAPKAGVRGKTVVMGLLQRHELKGGSRIRAKLVRTTTPSVLRGQIRQNVEPGAAVYTDSHPAYWGLDEFAHQAVDHAECYVRGRVHTNGLENFWSLLKRAIRGTYVNVEPYHLIRYVDEQVFRYNNRGDVDGGRFRQLASSITGKRLTYAKLIGATTTPA
ncbi:MAG: IS1595 family transposase [Dehalococcoidia bacterium]|jgi:transposase-like protein